MTLILAAVFIVAALAVIGESYYERDWPRYTWFRFILAVGLLAASMAVFGQGTRFDANVTTAATNVPPGAQAPTYTVPFAKIAVFQDAACSIATPFYSDAALTMAITPPLVADTQGKFSFYMPSGNYFYSVSSPKTNAQLGCYAFGITSGSGGNGFFTASATVGGIASSLTKCTAGQACGVNAGIGYPMIDTTLPAGVGQQLQDTRYGGEIQTIANPYANPFSLQGISPGSFSFRVTNCQQQLQPTAISISNPEDDCDHVQFVSSVIGQNYGYSGLGASGWNVMHARQTYAQFNGAGLKSGHYTVMTCAGIGDCIPHNTQAAVYGGNSVAGDESFKTHRDRIADAQTDYQGTLQTGSSETQLYLNPTRDNYDLGVERYMYRPASMVAGVMDTYTYQDSNRLVYVHDPSHTYAVSTFMGQMAHAVTATNEGGLPAGTYNACTNIVFNSGYTGSLATGVLIAFDTSYSETARVTGTACAAWVSSQNYGLGQGVTYGGASYTSTIENNVGNNPSSTSAWTVETVPSGGLLVAANLRWAHAAGRVFGGGMAGNGMHFTANTPANGLLYPVDVVGSPDAHTLAATMFIAGSANTQNFLGRVDTESHNINTVTVSAGGVATISFYDNTNQTIALQQQALITVSGNSNSSLNGQYALMADTVGDGQSLKGTFCGTTTGTCTASTTTGTGTGGAVTIGYTGYGNTSFVVGPIAKVLDGRDCRQQNVAGVGITQNGTAATLSANNLFAASSVGDTLEEAPLYSLGMVQRDEAITTSNVFTVSPGMMTFYWAGEGATSRTGLGLPRPWMQFINGNGYQQYLSGGGTGTTPSLFQYLGVHGAFIQYNDIPFPYNGTPMFDGSYAAPNLTAYPNAYFNPFRQYTLGFGSGGTGYGYCDPIHISISTGIMTLGSGCAGMQLASNPFGTNQYTFGYFPNNSGSPYYTLKLGQRPQRDSYSSIMLDPQGTGNGFSVDVFDNNVGLRFAQFYDSYTRAYKLRCTSGASCDIDSLTVGSGSAITNTNVVPRVGTPTVGQAACIKAAGPPVVIGYCSTVVSSTGACTCQ